MEAHPAPALADAACMRASPGCWRCSHLRRRARGRRAVGPSRAAARGESGLETRLSRLTGLEQAAFQLDSLGASGGAEVALLWDLDNLPVRGDPAVALLTAVRLQGLVAGLAEGPITHFAAYANAHTLARAAGRPGAPANVRQALQLAGCSLFQVKVRRNAADLVLRTHAAAFAEAAGSRGTLAIVSADGDHAAVAKYCRSRGCRVLAIGMLGRWDEAQPQRWARAQLAQQAGRAVRWSASRTAAASDGERAAMLALSARDPSAAGLVGEALGRPALAGTAVSQWASQPAGLPARAWAWPQGSSSADGLHASPGASQRLVA